MHLIKINFYAVHFTAFHKQRGNGVPDSIVQEHVWFAMDFYPK